MNFALNNIKSAGNSSWETVYSAKFTLTKDFPLKSEKAGQPSVPGLHLPYAIPMHSSPSNGVSACKSTPAKAFTQGLAFLNITFMRNRNSILSIYSLTWLISRFYVVVFFT